MTHEPWFLSRSVSGHGLLAQFQTNTLWVYDPNKTTWTVGPENDPIPTGNKRLAYFDPAMNVLVVIDGTNVLECTSYKGRRDDGW